MTFAQSILKAAHFNLRDYKAHISKYFKMSSPQIVTVNGQPTKVILNYNEVMELIDIHDELQSPKLVKEITAAKKAYKKSPESAVPADNFFEDWG